jgi:hypothetical protein
MGYAPLSNYEASGGRMRARDGEKNREIWSPDVIMWLEYSPRGVLASIVSQSNLKLTVVTD